MRCWRAKGVAVLRLRRCGSLLSDRPSWRRNDQRRLILESQTRGPVRREERVDDEPYERARRCKRAERRACLRSELLARPRGARRIGDERLHDLRGNVEVLRRDRLEQEPERFAL